MSEPFAFTEANIRSLDPPAKGRVYHRDAKLPGLQVCVTAAGTKTYFFVRRVDGRPTRIRLDTVERLSLADARDQARKEAGKIADGRNPQAERKARRIEPTLQEAWEHWLKYAQARKRPLSVEGDKLNWGKHLKAWAGRKLSRISRTEVQQWHAEVGEKCGPYAANRAMALLRSAINKAIDELGFRGPNPAARVQKFKETSRDRFLQPAELKAFFAALEGEEEVFADFFTLCLLTGARKNNVQTMRWGDLDLERGYWRIPETKSGVPIVVPLVPAAVEILVRRQTTADDCPWVFPGRRKGDYLREPREAWARICAAAGLNDLHIHDLRRSLGSWQAITGASLPVIGKSLGHSTPQATAIYARLSLDPVRKAFEAATEAMLAAKPQKALAAEPTTAREGE